MTSCLTGSGFKTSEGNAVTNTEPEMEITHVNVIKTEFIVIESTSQQRDWTAKSPFENGVYDHVHHHHILSSSNHIDSSP